jgi:hypothetical protein
MATKIKTVDMSIKPEDMKKSKEPEVTVATSDKKTAPVARKEKKSPDRRPSHHRGHGKVDNWVCVNKGDEVLRVERKTVEAKYINQGWNYCPKSLWKQKVRDAGSAPQVTPAPKKSKKPKATPEA